MKEPGDSVKANHEDPSVTDQIKKDLSNFPKQLTQAFESAHGQLEGRLSEESLFEWANIGQEISLLTVRSWEAAQEFFDASPSVQRQLPSGQFLRWGRTGHSLCKQSPGLAVSFFKASPTAMLRLRPRYIDDWANIGGTLYRGTWKSSALAANLFKVTPRLLETISFDEFCKFGEFLELLSRRSYDIADKCLNASVNLFRNLGKDTDQFISLAVLVAKQTWRDMENLFETASTTLGNLPSSQRSRLLSLTKQLIVVESSSAAQIIKDGVFAITRAPNDSRDQLLDLTERLSEVHNIAAIDFLKNAPVVMERITFSQLIEWHERGLVIAREKPTAASSFFRIESEHSVEALDSLSSSVELNRIKDILKMYCRALTGRNIEVSGAQQLADKSIGWFQGELPTTEGSTVFLPHIINRYINKEENFGFYKVVSTHQIAHIEFGSFEFDFRRPSNLFRDIRPELPVNTTLTNQSNITTDTSQISDKELETSKIEKREFATDMSMFLRSFPDNKLALDVFTIVESTRVDSLVINSYRGITSMYKRVQKAALESRPNLEELPARESLVELLIRWSLGQNEGLKAPKDHIGTVIKLKRLLRIICEPDATVEDAAEATIRIYSLLTNIVNDNLKEDEFESLEPDTMGDDENDDNSAEEPDENLEQIIQHLIESMNSFSSENDQGEVNEEEVNEGEDSTEHDDYSSPQEIDYRGEFKPELSQMLSQIQASDGFEIDSDTDGMEPISQEQIEEMMKNAPEMEQDSKDADGQNSTTMDKMIENLMNELKKRDPKNQQFQNGPIQHIEEDGGPLEATEPNTYTYDEWDFRAGEYKTRWCLVNEKEMANGETDFYKQTLIDNRSLIGRIRRQFELVVPEMYRKQKRLEDGEEQDLDATLEAIIDMKIGTSPNEKIYWRRNKTERSVSVAFLLDMSASTAEAIDEAKKPNDDWAAPDDPVEYMVWLRSRRSEGLRRTYKRIIDVEKEGIVLLIDSLEKLGDDYGIYGFSGYGRENVEYYVVKDLDERFSDEVPKRIDRIAPLHATRMGPAIRHTIHKLSEHDARSRFLFLISDGRPQDRGYSREGVEKEYAVHDTRQALIEAKQMGITPFCLTVDKAGHDYLKTMMDDFSYEVLADVSMLPVRLPLLYRALTT